MRAGERPLDELSRVSSRVTALCGGVAEPLFRRVPELRAGDRGAGRPDVMPREVVSSRAAIARSGVRADPRSYIIPSPLAVDWE